VSDWKTFAGLGQKSYRNQQGGRGGTGRRKGLKIFSDIKFMLFFI
jgi:hypothetical protein